MADSDAGGERHGGAALPDAAEGPARELHLGLDGLFLRGLVYTRARSSAGEVVELLRHLRDRLVRLPAGLEGAGSGR